MKKFLLAVVAICICCVSVSPLYAQFENVQSLAVASYGDADWGDFDNDGDLDLITIGITDNLPSTIVYKNESGQFTKHISLTGVHHGSCDWGDFDNDGDLDLLVLGARNNSVWTPNPITSIYKNDNGIFSIVMSSETQLPAVWFGEGRWADLNNDGWLDIVICGNDSKTLLFASDRKGNFFKVTDLPEIIYGNISVGDFDVNGFLDVAISGTNGMALYRNKGNWQFEFVTNNFLACMGGELQMIDVDQDGDLDLVSSGSVSGIPSNVIYENRQTFFSRVVNTATLDYTSATGSTAVGDFDNDGDSDIASNDGKNPVLLENLAIDNIVPVHSGFPGVDSGSVAWADFDRDHDLDIYIGSRLLRNNIGTKNSAPAPPSIVQFDSVYNNVVFIHWNKGTDHETSPDGLTYQLYVGTASKKQDVVSANADVETGARKLSEPGSLKQNRYMLHDLKGGEYFFGVQSVDAANEGSLFSEEKKVSLITITGRSIACQSISTTYSAEPAGSYTWEIVGGTIESGQGTSQIEVRWSSLGKGLLKVANVSGARNTLEVLVDTAPDASLAGDLTVCTGVQRYSVTGQFSSVEWNVSAPNSLSSENSVQVDVNWKVGPEQNLVVKAYSPKGCYIEVSKKVLVDVLVPSNLRGETNTCQFDEEQYSNTSSTAVWGVESGEITYNLGNRVSVKWITPEFGKVFVGEVSERGFCSSSDTIKVYMLPRPPKPTIKIFQDSILFSSPSPGGYYLWYYYDEPVIFGEYQGVISEVPGVFSVEIFARGADCGSKSDPFTFIITGVEENEVSDDISLVAHPNPAVESITLELMNADGTKCDIEVYSNDGTLIFSRSFDSTEDLSSQEIDVSSLSSGGYVVKLKTAKAVYRTRFIKK